MKIYIWNMIGNRSDYSILGVGNDLAAVRQDISRRATLSVGQRRTIEEELPDYVFDFPVDEDVVDFRWVYHGATYATT